MAEPLKNYYNKKFIKNIAKAMKAIHSDFNDRYFMQLIFDDAWDSRELKDRMRHVTISLGTILPKDYETSINILKSAAPLMHGVSDFGGFLNMFFPDFVEMYGQADWEPSILALEFFTPYSSSEFAVRPFIKQDSKRMMKQMKLWAKHDNYHVRRLASEGCRPRLPWAMALPDFKQDPSAILPILNILKNDEQEYVRRSVANNLNDIAKDNPDIVINIAQKWYGKNETTNRLVKHACRTLLKSGNKEALTIFGFTDTAGVNVKNLKTQEKDIKISESLAFSFDVIVKKVSKLRVEYAIDYMKANGTKSRKIFQIREGHYEKGIFRLSKQHSFREMSTRKHYAGKHYIAIIVNGLEMENISFNVK
tara:strand:- start:99507 stop:100598 length:1092 start_codon:yes stop_codon:yes gene_type:complete